LKHLRLLRNHYWPLNNSRFDRSFRKKLKAGQILSGFFLSNCEGNKSR